MTSSSQQPELEPSTPTHATTDGRGLPPGQRLAEGFPRFGAHRPPAAIPADPVIEIRGSLTEPFDVPLGDLDALPSREVTADFHCVAGWSATGLRWQGVSFRTLYRELIAPRVLPGPAVTHLAFRGLDGWWSVIGVDDAMADDVLVADRLDGLPLNSDHGAPVRLVSPSQYGFVSTKHLCRIEVHAGMPKLGNPAARRIGRFTLPTLLIRPHPRARVALEERHENIPGRLIRPVYRLLTRVASRPSPR